MSIYNAMGIKLRWKKFNNMLEIDIIRYLLQNIVCVDCPVGRIWMIWVSKWDPDAILAKTKAEGGCNWIFISNIKNGEMFTKIDFYGKFNIKWAALMVNRDFGPSKLPRLFETSL